MSNRYLSPSAVSDRYKPVLTLTRLERLRRAGAGPRWRKVGGRIYYTIEDVERYLNAVLRTTDDDPAKEVTDG